MSNHFYTASEAQDILGISKGMFFRKVQEGLIPKIILPGMKQGVYPKRDIDVDEMEPFVRLEPFGIYIDVIAVDPNLPAHVRHLYAGLLVSHAVDLLANLIANGYQITHIYTVTSTEEGDNLVKKLGFRHLEKKSIVHSRSAYEYV